MVKPPVGGSVKREVAGAVSGVACFWATSLEKIIGGVTAIISFPLERMDAAVCRVEVCYPFCRRPGRAYLLVMSPKS